MEMPARIADVILSGTYATDVETKAQTMLRLKPMSWFVFDEAYVAKEAARKKIAVDDEEKYFKNLTMDFVLGSVREESFRSVLTKRIVDFDDFLRFHGIKDQNRLSLLNNSIIAKLK